uniref:3,2-trans-enoyl-CoA isomerase, mitochondrial n=1 Tax=Parastrongyloides trichosuri TaxID=131310 RepID=A0A0N4Z1A1_PARTI
MLNTKLLKFISRKCCIPQYKNNQLFSTNLSSEVIKFEKEHNVGRITFNRVDKLNSMNLDFFIDLKKALKVSNDDDDINLTVITNNGKFFSNGFDYEMFKGMSRDEVKEFSKILCDSIGDLMDAYVYHKKPLIGVVKGPAIGCAFTSIGIFDYTLCSDKTYFHSPSSRIGLSPMDFSLYIFPKMMGPAKAKELLMFGRKITAYNALRLNLVNEVIRAENMDRISEERINEFLLIEGHTLKTIKNIMNIKVRDDIHFFGRKEIEIFKARMKTDYFYDSVMKIINEKKN